MNKGKSRMLALQKQASARFANMSGDPSVYQKRSGYGHANGLANALVGPQGTYSARIENTDEVNDLTVELFHKNSGLIDPFDGVTDVVGVTAGAGKGLIVKFGQDSHEVIKNRTIHEPTFVEGMKYFANSAEQLAQNWTLLKRANNSRQDEDYYPQEHISAAQQQDNIVEDRYFAMAINADSGIRFKILKAPSASVSRIVTITFQIRVANKSQDLVRGVQPIKVNPQDPLGGGLFL